MPPGPKLEGVDSRVTSNARSTRIVVSGWMRHQNQACTVSVLGVNLCETADVSARLGNTAAAAVAPPAALVAHQQPQTNLMPLI